MTCTFMPLLRDFVILFAMAMSRSLSFLKSVTFWVENIVSRLASKTCYISR